MHPIIGTSLGKAVRGLTRLKGGGGQALPGLIVERLMPNYLSAMLGKLPDGVVVITGTNGKTTTTKMVVELLRANGKRVLTNPTGSNFTRGIISSLTQQAKVTGKLPFDIGVFELDEAYARRFVEQVRPKWVLALNVMRDQLDRFGELDTTAKLIATTMRAATEGVIVNDDDARLVTAAQSMADQKQIVYFGVEPRLRQFFPVDDELVAAVGGSKPKSTKHHERGVELSSFEGQEVTFDIAGQIYQTRLQLNGQHNFQNAAAALTTVLTLMPNAEPKLLVSQLANVDTAFGRGQIFTLKDGSHLQLILVKNPGSFRQALASYPVTSLPVMMAVNDNYADGRDVSWLWDVDFSILKDKILPLTTGSRAADMALRLSYDGVQVERVEPDLKKALSVLCQVKGDKLIISTYTAMLVFYKTLKKQAGKTL